MATRYRRRAVEVYAFRLGNLEPDWWLALSAGERRARLVVRRDVAHASAAPLRANEGDWIVRYADGSTEVFDPAAFAEAFEEVPR